MTKQMLERLPHKCGEEFEMDCEEHDTCCFNSWVRRTLEQFDQTEPFVCTDCGKQLSDPSDIELDHGCCESCVQNRMMKDGGK